MADENGIHRIIDRKSSKLIAVSSVILTLITALVLVAVRYGEAEARIEEMGKENQNTRISVKEIRSDIRELEKANEKDHREIVTSLGKIEASIEALKTQAELDRRRSEEISRWHHGRRNN